MDYLDDRLYIGEKIPEVDRPTWKIRLPGISQPVVVRYGGKKRKTIVSAPWISLAEKPNLKYSLILTVPKSRLRAGVWRLSSSLAAHSGSQKMSWKANVTVAP
jgi:hypothetical protein